MLEMCTGGWNVLWGVVAAEGGSKMVHDCTCLAEVALLISNRAQEVVCLPLTTCCSVPSLFLFVCPWLFAVCLPLIFVCLPACLPLIVVSLLCIVY